MKQCLKCKKELQDNAKFCISCGSELPTTTKEQEIDVFSKCPKCGEPYPEWVKNMYELVSEIIENRVNK